MSIEVGEDIGLEVHQDVDQFLRIEEGKGLVQMGDSEDNLESGNMQKRMMQSWSQGEMAQSHK